MATYYIDPNGSDSNTGSSSSPWFSIGHAGSNVAAGDTIIVNDGTYEYSTAQHCDVDGTSSNPITAKAASGASPVFAFQGSTSTGGFNYDSEGGVWFDGVYWQAQDLTVETSPYHGFIMPSGGGYTTLTNCVARKNHLCGIKVFSSSDHTLDGCVAFDNYGNTNSGSDSDGIALSGSSVTGITIRDCEAYYNSDDGIDLWASSGTLVKRTMSYNNGRDGGDGNGFKMGGDTGSGDNTADRCLAWRNRSDGFNHNTTEPLYFYHCTTWDNGNYGYATDDAKTEIYNSISYNDDGGNAISAATTSNNTWNLGITNPQFRSTATTNDGYESPQNYSEFLHLQSDSPCIDAGGAISGTTTEDVSDGNPDLGGYEYSGSATKGGTLKFYDGSEWVPVST